MLLEVECRIAGTGKPGHKIYDSCFSRQYYINLPLMSSTSPTHF